jgi:transcriptional regulator NrdR family protein
MIKRDIYVIKSSGERELFSEVKLRHSLERSQASPECVKTSCASCAAG